MSKSTDVYGTANAPDPDLFIEREYREKQVDLGEVVMNVVEDNTTSAG